ncbi:hypothetical protein [Staphylococcus phage vB_StaM_SA1]|nr:hypothetical protein [Staphylococcus phage vB_StaM_SA1]
MLMTQFITAVLLMIVFFATGGVKFLKEILKHK